MSQQRLTKAQMRIRVDEVHKMLVHGIGRPEITRICIEQRGWDVKQRQIDNYIARAGELLENESKVRREVERGKAKARFETQYFKADSRKDHRGAVVAAREIVDLFGLQEPKRIEASGPNGGPIVVAGALQQLEDEIVASILARADPDDPG